MVVLYGYQGADADAEQLALTEQLFDVALGEVCVFGRGQPCMPVGDFNVEPTKIPCLAKRRIRLGSGLILKLLGLWLVVCSLLLLASVPGILMVVIGGTSWLVALLLLLFFLVGFSLTGGLLLILLSEPFLIVLGGLVGLLNRVSFLLSGVLLGCLLLIRGRFQVGGGPESFRGS